MQTKSALLAGAAIMALLAQPAAAQQIQSVIQEAGSVGVPGTSVTLQSLNTIAAENGGPLLGTAMSGGSQNAGNILNSADLGAATSALISQTAVLPTLGAGNTISASAVFGPVVVNGGGGQQAATNMLNAASVALPTAGFTADVTLNQIAKAPTIGSTNTASAAVLGGAVDPMVKNLGQIASINLNSMALPDGSTVTNGVVTPVAAIATLSGTQSLRSDPAVAGPVVSAFTIGNTASALATAANASGPVGVENVAQGGSLTINTVTGGSGTSLSAGLFEQSVASNEVNVNGVDVTAVPAGAVSAGFLGGQTVNLQLAATNSGTAGVTGPANLLAQSYVGNVNSIATGGTISGDVNQKANDQTTNLGNLALADTTAGRAAISGVSQSLKQSFNTVDAGALGGLALSQTAGNLSIGSANYLGANGTTSATIGGGSQQTVNAVNVLK